MRWNLCQTHWPTDFLACLTDHNRASCWPTRVPFVAHLSPRLLACRCPTWMWWNRGIHQTPWVILWQNVNIWWLRSFVTSCLVLLELSFSMWLEISFYVLLLQHCISSFQRLYRMSNCNNWRAWTKAKSYTADMTSSMIHIFVVLHTVNMWTQSKDIVANHILFI